MFFGIDRVQAITEYRDRFAASIQCCLMAGNIDTSSKTAGNTKSCGD
jgi:hypothetical protein